MRRILALLLLLVPLAGGGWFFSNFKLEGLQNVIFRPRASEDATATGVEQVGLGEPRDPKTIRIASFNIQVFGTSKAGKMRVMEILTQIVRQFDVVAVQEIRAKDQTLIPNFIRQINANGAQYDFVLGPRLGNTSSKEQYAFLYDTQSIEVDKYKTYTMSDPNNRMHREPLVAQFRTRGAPATEAFTFKLVNVHTDPDVVEEEMNALDDVYRAVLNDGDGEDDVIMLGDFNTSEKKLYQVGEMSDITTALADVMTNTRGTKAYDNLIFNARHTNEFLGRAGVVDIVRVFNITTDEALEVSDHLPVWGLFSVYEGGGVGRIATQPDAPTTVR